MACHNHMDNEANFKEQSLELRFNGVIGSLDMNKLDAQ